MAKIEDLFKEQENEIYDRYSTKDGGGQGIVSENLKFSEPFIEHKPNDPERDIKQLDSRALPIGSIAEQEIRVGKALTTPRGVTFLTKQRLLRRQAARPDLAKGDVLGLEEGKLSAEILASLAPPVRGERFGSQTFGDQNELYSKSGLQTRLGSRVNETSDADNLTIKKGMTNYADRINRTTIVDSNDESTIDDLTDASLIPLYFNDLVNEKTVFFRATISGLNESTTPEWNPIEYVGRPFKSYYYRGVDRSVSFSFLIYPLNANELITNWERYNYLKGLTYPAGYTRRTRVDIQESANDVGGGQNQTGTVIDPGREIGFIQPPFIEFTIGNLYKNRPAIITSLDMEIPEESPWEIGGTRITKRAKDNSVDVSDGGQGFFSQLKEAASSQIRSAFSTAVGRYEEGEVVEGINEYKLPKYIRVSVNLTILERNLISTGDRLHDFGEPVG